MLNSLLNDIKDYLSDAIVHLEAVASHMGATKAYTAPAIALMDVSISHAVPTMVQVEVTAAHAEAPIARAEVAIANADDSTA